MNHPVARNPPNRARCRHVAFVNACWRSSNTMLGSLTPTILRPWDPARNSESSRVEHGDRNRCVRWHARTVPLRRRKGRSGVGRWRIGRAVEAPPPWRAKTLQSLEGTVSRCVEWLGRAEEIPLSLGGRMRKIRLTPLVLRKANGASNDTYTGFDR